MQEVKISVIIPMYNAEKYIVRCVESILAQTLKEIEVIIIDDESKDNSFALCKEIANKDERVRLISQKNAGPGLARNKGLEVAQGEYVAFVDSDDTVAIDMYENLYRAVKENNADSCLCGFNEVEIDGTIIDNTNPLGGNCYQGEQVISEVLLNILGSKPHAASDFVLGIAVWKGLYSKRIIEENKLCFFSERIYYSEDTMFNVDYFLHAKRVVMIKECYYQYQKNSTSFTATYKPDMHERNIRFYHAVEERLRDLECYSEARMRLQRLFLGFVRCYLQRIVKIYSAKDAIRQLRAICMDDTIIEVMQQYPYKLNPWKQRLIHQMIAKKNVFMTWVLLKMH